MILKCRIVSAAVLHLAQDVFQELLDVMQGAGITVNLALATLKLHVKDLYCA